jgi:hypothetical protein
MPPLADRIGRRPVLALCALVFGVLSIRGVARDRRPDDGRCCAACRDLLFGDAADRAALPVRNDRRARRASFMAIALVCFSGATAPSGR